MEKITESDIRAHAMDSSDSVTRLEDVPAYIKGFVAGGMKVLGMTGTAYPWIDTNKELPPKNERVLFLENYEMTRYEPEKEHPEIRTLKPFVLKTIHIGIYNGEEFISLIAETDYIYDGESEVETLIYPVIHKVTHWKPIEIPQL